MALYQWSTTPATNATAGTINFAEGQVPSTVNDSARQLMADVATFMVNPQFYNFGDVPTYVSATQFTIPGNQTANYTVNRRIKATVTAGTIYGSITVSAYTALTTVTVVLDSGALDAGLSDVGARRVRQILVEPDDREAAEDVVVFVEGRSPHTTRQSTKASVRPTFNTVG